MGGLLIPARGMITGPPGEHKEDWSGGREKVSAGQKEET
jgi:hypothetical protein